MLEAQWPARLQRLRGGPLVARAPAGAEVWLDGAHNDAGGRVLAEAMADFEEAGPRPLAMICGTLKSKDTAAFLVPFQGAGARGAGRADSRASTRRGRPRRSRPSPPAPGSPRAWPAASARRWTRWRAQNWPVPPRVLIAGSLYLAGAVLEENGAPPT